MKKIFTLLGIILCFLVVYTGNGQIRSSEGIEFWFGLPFADISSDESIRGSETNSPYELFITSRYNATVKIYLSGSELLKTVSVIADTPNVISLPDGFINSVSEKVEKKGFYIVSDFPIEVTAYISWQWTGEAFRLLPLYALGTDYFTLNLYQDYNKDHAGSYRYHPAQILVVATEDSTDVTYTPTYQTQKGVKKQLSKTIRLNKGETFNIMGRIDNSYNQTWASDLTGSHITSTKPVAVFSGQTKGCFPRHSPTLLGLKADFMRNLTIEQMIPTNLLGTEYVSVPILYTGRTTGFGTTPEDRGDIIRFVATEDGTRIQRMNDDGSRFVNFTGILKKGEDYRIIECETPRFYKANHPILVGQYGKAWWQHSVNAKIEDNNKDDDELMNPPKNGQGMMMNLISNERWVNESRFNSPKNDMFNYVSIVCKTIHVDSIYFDNRLLKNEFGSKLKKINGTPYSYVSSQINRGGHIVRSNQDSITFAVYSFGNLDGIKDGFAYGTFSGLAVRQECNVDFSVADTVSCYEVNGTISVRNTAVGTDCNGIEGVELYKISPADASLKMNNFINGDSTVSYTLSIKNPDVIYEAGIRAISKSGLTHKIVYSFPPRGLDAANKVVEISRIPANQSRDTIVEIKNLNSSPININKLYLKNGNKGFEIKNLDYYINKEILPNSSIQVLISCAVADDNILNIKDTLLVELSCYADTLCELFYNSGAPYINLSDIDFGIINPDIYISKLLSIKNTGSIADTITGMQNSNVYNFQIVDTILPIIIQPYSSVNVKVKFYANSYGVYNDEIFITSRATESKLFSMIKGECRVPNELKLPNSPEITLLYKDLTRTILEFKCPDKITNGETIDSIYSVQCYINDSFSMIFTGADIVPGALAVRYLDLRNHYYDKINLRTISKVDSMYLISQNSKNAHIYSNTALTEYFENFDSSINDRVAFNGNWNKYNNNYYSPSYSISDNIDKRTAIGDYNFDFALAPIEINDSNFIMNFWDLLTANPNFTVSGYVYICQFKNDMNNAYNYQYAAILEPTEIWRQTYIDLKYFKGRSIYVLFKLYSSIDMLPNVGNIGWYIDNVKFTDKPLSVEEIKLQSYSVTIQPNPIEENAEVYLNLNKDGNINIELYNSNGEFQLNVFNNYLNKGEKKIPFNLKNLPSGKYFIRIKFADSIKDYSIIKIR